MAEEVQAEQGKPKGGNKALMIILIVVVVILLSVVGVGAYLYFSGALGAGHEAADKNGTHAKTEHEEKAHKPEATFEAAINDLVLNITDAKGNEKLMKLSFSMQSQNEKIQAIVDKNKAEITDAVIVQIGSRSAEEMLTLGGKELLKEELLDEINKILNNANSGAEHFTPNCVEKIFFTSFVLK